MMVLVLRHVQIWRKASALIIVNVKSFKSPQLTLGKLQNLGAHHQ